MKNSLFKLNFRAPVGLVVGFVEVIDVFCCCFDYTCDGSTIAIARNIPARTIVVFLFILFYFF